MRACEPRNHRSEALLTYGWVRSGRTGAGTGPDALPGALVCGPRRLRPTGSERERWAGWLPAVAGRRAAGLRHREAGRTPGWGYGRALAKRLASVVIAVSASSRAGFHHQGVESPAPGGLRHCSAGPPSRALGRWAPSAYRPSVRGLSFPMECPRLGSTHHQYARGVNIVVLTPATRRPATAGEDRSTRPAHCPVGTNPSGPQAGRGR